MNFMALNKMVNTRDANHKKRCSDHKSPIVIISIALMFIDKKSNLNSIPNKRSITKGTPNNLFQLLLRPTTNFLIIQVNFLMYGIIL